MSKTYEITAASGESKELIVPANCKVPHTISVSVSGGASAVVAAKAGKTAAAINWEKGVVSSATEDGRYTPVYSYTLTVTVAGSATMYVAGV